MDGEDDLGNYVHISVRNLTSRMVGAFMLGGSLVGAGQAYINSITSVEVAVQHGEEIQKIRGDLHDLEREVARRMADRWTRTDQMDHKRSQSERDESQDRRIEAVERVVDSL